MLDSAQLIKNSKAPARARSEAQEPSLVCRSDVETYQRGLDALMAGRWPEERWTTFRLRFGVYGQKQADKHMVRAKIPGGNLSFGQARAIAKANRLYAGSDVHLTTRQDVQFYFVELAQTSGLIGALADGGVTTREASGNTFRNVVACPLAGICAHERVDAGEVAQKLSTSWIRHPLVQHMPRKVKIAVSGCGQDCAHARMDDLGLIAIEKDGKPGFRVFLGGGLGLKPHIGIEVMAFVEEHDLPAVQEAAARLHHARSNRKQKAASRLKFLVDRFGEEDLRTQFAAYFEAARKNARDDWRPLTWKTPAPDEDAPQKTFDFVDQTDGRLTVMIRVPLGMIGSDRLEELVETSEQWGAQGLRLTRNQNILAVGLPREHVDDFVVDVQGLGLSVAASEGGLGDLVACPGTSTCPIGITNSNGLARELLAHRGDFDDLPETRIRLSGCHNSCGRHHVGDFGLHGLARKLKGVKTPFYAIHLGGEPEAGRIAIEGPEVPARQAVPALKAVMTAYRDQRKDGESVRSWAERMTAEELEALVAPFQEYSGDGMVHIDWGEDGAFVPPGGIADCAAPVAVGEYMADLATVALEDAEAAERRGSAPEANVARRLAGLWAARRLLLISGHRRAEQADAAAVIEGIKTAYADDAPIVTALAGIEAALIDPDGREPVGRRSLKTWITEAEVAVERRLEAQS